MPASMDLKGEGPTAPEDLRQLHMFNDVEDGLLGEVFAQLRRTKHKNRTTIIVEQEFAGRIGFAWSGEYRIGVAGPAHTITLYAVRPRMAFLYAPALLGHKFGDTHRLFVDRSGFIIDMPAEKFLALPARSPIFARNLIKRLATHALEYGTRVYELAATNTHDRLLAELLRRAHGVPGGGDRRLLDPSPTHASLAALVGATREAVSRQLKALATEGLIELKRGKITIVSMRELRRREEAAMGRRILLPDAQAD